MTEDSSNLRKTSSMDEWQNYGERLTRLHHELVTLLVDAGKTVPHSELEDLEKALERVDTARSDLEGRMTREHDPDEWDLDVFYGGIPEDYTEWREALPKGSPETGDKIAVHDGGYIALSPRWSVISEENHQLST